MRRSAPSPPRSPTGWASGSPETRGALLHRGQGKWYPGEPLPRWQIARHWRTDGVPLWPRTDLLADPWNAEPDPTAPERAARLARGIVEALGLPPEQLHAAFEDPLAALVRAVGLPAGPPPDREPGADDVAALDAGVTTPTAHVLPLHPLRTDTDTEDASGDATVAGGAPRPAATAAPAGAAAERDWASPTWRFRRGRLVLTPGDSPAGLRLPLDAVSWTEARTEPEPSYLHGDAPVRTPALRTRVLDLDESEDAPLTAVVVEARDGIVHLFLPPLDDLDDVTALLGVIHDVVAAQEVPIVVEGYPPPPDPRLATLMVTPDPGVIEVNLQPTASWPALRELTTTLYETAREVRLGTEKFDLDGLHTGTGGGNHLTLGGPTPDRSPILRRPDLLVSMLTFWQHHPALSYLFSGRFVGPTSQAPRADEGRAENLYELEIAFAEIERLGREATDEGGVCPPWVVDRALRHLLTDLTGNTHRAEFCIDKLYSPDTSRGRLGLLELRGFEMPPHAQMGLLQAALVRALVARFAAEPYRKPLVRWGAALHERFLLPSGCADDVAEVCADLRAHGIAMEEEWFAPFLEFRFPRIGTTNVAGVELELRQAVEPWKVLGEEPAGGGGTARYVDSSVERVQVQVTGAVPGRHLVTCNGVPVPLAPTTTTGRLVASVRYRAWQPHSALHPSIEVHSPLRLDVIDLAAERSLGGCTYHVVHPGGRSYDVIPVNASEAESRRAGRFEERGHMTGRVDVATLEAEARRTRSPEHPHTLDLRRHVPRSWGG